MRSGPRRSTLLAVIACSALAIGCGGGGLGQRLTPGQESDLHTLIERGRTAAVAGDLAATHAALERLNTEVRALREKGALGDDSAAELLKISAVTELKATRTLQPAAPAAPATVAAPPAAATSPAASPPAGKKAKGKAKGKKGD